MELAKMIGGSSGAVQEFSSGRQSDDLTLLLGRVMA